MKLKITAKATTTPKKVIEIPDSNSLAEAIRDVGENGGDKIVVDVEPLEEEYRDLEDSHGALADELDQCQRKLKQLERDLDDCERRCRGYGY